MVYNRRKYSPRFLGEIVVDLPSWSDEDCKCVHRDVFEDEKVMDFKLKEILKSCFRQEHGKVFRIRKYRLYRIKEN